MPIRTAILGYGRSGGTMHAGAIERNPAFEMTAVCDVDAACRERAAARFRCRTYEDYREMLAREKLDLVCVVTRSDQHCAMACDCLRAGADTLVTKPWAANAAEARRMISCARRSGRRLLPWLPARWGRDLLRLQELVQQDAIGKVFLVRRTVASFGTRCDWQTERRYAGGYLLNWGPHIVDPPLLLAGYRVKSVYGRLRQWINPGDAEDLFLAVLTLDDGRLVQVEYTLSAEPLPEWVLQGDRGTIVLNWPKLRIHRHTPQRPTDPTRFATVQAATEGVTEETLAGERYGDEHVIYAGIAAALQGGPPYAVTPADGLRLSRLLDAIRASSATDRIVKFSDRSGRKEA
jgi:predicted dehydrogenase